MRLLTEELHEVFEWFSLGLHLDIPPPELYGIKHDPTIRSTEGFRTEMLSRWMTKLPKPSWYRVVKALMEIGRETLAHKISLKYGKATRLLFLCACIRSLCLDTTQVQRHQVKTGNKLSQVVPIFM